MQFTSTSTSSLTSSTLPTTKPSTNHLFIMDDSLPAPLLARTSLQKTYTIMTTHHNLPATLARKTIANAIRTFTRVALPANPGPFPLHPPVDGFFSNIQKALVEYVRDADTREAYGMRFVALECVERRQKKLGGSFSADPFGFNEKVRRGGAGLGRKGKGNEAKMKELQVRRGKKDGRRVWSALVKVNLDRTIAEMHRRGRVSQGESLVLQGLWGLCCGLEDTEGDFLGVYLGLRDELEKMAEEYDEKEDAMDVDV